MNIKKHINNMKRKHIIYVEYYKSCLPEKEKIKRFNLFIHLSI